MNSKNKIAETKAKTESEWYQVAENDFGMMFADPRSNSRYENLIGYFRGDFGKDGTSFYQTWFSVHPNDIYGDLQMTDYPLQKVFPMLESFRKMCDFCSGNPKFRFPPSFASDNFGFVTGEGSLIFYVRLLPHMGDYHFYVFCYESEVADRIGIDLTFWLHPSHSRDKGHTVSVCGLSSFEEAKERIPGIIKTECLRSGLPEGIYLLETEFRRYNLCTKKDEYLDSEEVYLLYENGEVSFLSDGSMDEQ